MLQAKRIFPILAAGALTAAAAFAQTTTSGTVTRTFTFEPVGLASSETAQINVVNTASNSSSGTAASCTGTLSFVRSTGAAVGTASNFTVTSGQIATATLPYATLAASGRAVVRGVVTLTFTTGTGAAPCELETSLETFDTSTGVTHLHMGGDGPAGPGRH